MAFKLPALGYDFDALEPHIDAETMKIHHGKHHAGYTRKLNGAIAGTDLEKNPLKRSSEMFLNMEMMFAIMLVDTTIILYSGKY